MVEIMKCYRSKGVVSEVCSSTLLKRRQDEADAAINSLVRRLEVCRLVLSSGALRPDATKCQNLSCVKGTLKKRVISSSCTSW